MELLQIRHKKGDDSLTVVAFGSEPFSQLSRVQLMP